MSNPIARQQATKPFVHETSVAIVRELTFGAWTPSSYICKQGVRGQNVSSRATPTDVLVTKYDVACWLLLCDNFVLECVLAFTHKTMEILTFCVSHDPQEKTVMKIHWKFV